MKPATAKISSVALKHNIQTIKQKAPNSKIIAVVKANAYGHGVVFVSSAVESLVDCFGVARLEEALKLNPEIEEIIPDLLEFMEDLPLLGHRVLFDYSFIKKAAVNLNLDLKKEGIDTLELSRFCLPKEQSKVLKEACKFMEIDIKDWHRALPDARASHCLYQALKLRFADLLADKNIKKELNFKIKKEQKASRTQKEHLLNILNCHKITLDKDIDTLSKNQISRIIDKIKFNKGYIDSERK